ncbi:MAG: hypothetical protein ACK4HE_04775 [Chitinophagaceae bacterium]
MSKHILFISSVNLTTNPRILKEIKLAIQIGYEVSFIGFRLGNWSDKIEAQHQKKFSGLANLIYLDATRENYFQWLISTVLEKLSRLVYPIYKKNFFINSLGHNKRSYILNQYLTNGNFKQPDLVIAHTLVTLYPAFRFAQDSKIPFAFDVEDFHPGEKIHSDVENEKQRRIFLLKKILPYAKYVSCASPLIAFEMQELLKSTNETEDLVFTINNTFSKYEFIQPEQLTFENQSRLKFIWFSQNISFGRGLEIVIPILEKYAQHITLELVGRIDSIFYEQFIKTNTKWIKITEPLSQVALHQYLSQFDIGLAIEMNTADYNRELALTNKIIAYFQSGLYIFSTNTKAQEAFLGDKKNHGICIGQSSDDLRNGIEFVLSRKIEILKNKQQRFQDAKTFNWENESDKLQLKWNKILV